MKRVGLSIVLMLALMFIFSVESNAARCSTKQLRGAWSFYMSGSDAGSGWYVVCDVALDSFGEVLGGACFDSWGYSTENIVGFLAVASNCTAYGEFQLNFGTETATYYVDYASASKTTSLGVGEDDLKLRFSFTGQKR